jgi:hypothetical protein
MQKYSALFPLRAERRSVFVGALRAVVSLFLFAFSTGTNKREKNLYTHRVADWMSQLNKLFRAAAPMEI